MRGAETRLRGLCDENETLVGHHHADETEDGHYYLVIREKPHPDRDDARILSERYAYLTKHPGDGSDGWLDNGINRRVTGDREDAADLAADLAQLYAQTAADLRNGDT